MAEKPNFCQRTANSFRNFGVFFYRKQDVNGVETTLVMGRSGNSWAKIGLFYVCFYSFLAGFFAAMLSVFMTTINTPGTGPPRLRQYIINKPGLTIVNSMGAQYDNTFNSTDWQAFTKAVDDHLKKYNSSKYSSIECSEDDNGGYKGDVPCKFNTAQALGPNCTKANGYGMRDGRPCILLKLNKVYDWVPDGKDKYLTVECNQGVEVVNGGFLKGAMPFRGQTWYANPIVALVMPESKTAITVRCFLKGENIEISESYNPKRSYGNIEFTVASPKE